MKKPSAGIMQRSTIDAGGLGAIAVISLASWLLIARPIVEQESRRWAQYATMNDRNDQHKRLQKELRAQRETLDAALRIVDGDDLALQAPRDINRRISQLADTALKAGLRVDRVRHERVVRLDEFSTIEIRLVSTGQYTHARSFLEAIHRDFDDTIVKSLAIRSRSVDLEYRSDVDVTLVWFVNDSAGASDRRQLSLGARRQ